MVSLDGLFVSAEVLFLESLCSRESEELWSGWGGCHGRWWWWRWSSDHGWWGGMLLDSGQYWGARRHVVVVGVLLQPLHQLALPLVGHLMLAPAGLHVTHYIPHDTDQALVDLHLW